jgi:hypothetical protein
MSDYVAKARDASRRWRAAQGLPPREDDLSALPSLASPPQTEKSRETLAHGVNAIKETKETKEKKTSESLDFLTFSSETEPRLKLSEAPPTVALRRAYREWFALAVCGADGRPITPAIAHALHQQIVKLTDEAGPLWADALFTEELRRFRADTGRCGLCGGLGHPLEDAPE